MGIQQQAAGRAAQQGRAGVAQGNAAQGAEPDLARLLGIAQAQGLVGLQHRGLHVPCGVFIQRHAGQGRPMAARSAMLSITVASAWVSVWRTLP